MSNQGFTLAEDAALKSRLQNLTVSDDRDYQRPVKVFFRHPEAEVEKQYPFVTLELIGINHARNRQVSEMSYYYSSDASLGTFNDSYSLSYFPSEYAEGDMDTFSPTGTYVVADSFVPVDLTYQVSTYARSQRHDRQLTSAILRYVFPLRRGFIEIPEDGTTRRLDLLNWRQADLLDQESGYKKRIFRKVFTVQMNAEIPQSGVYTVPSVADVSVTLEEEREGYHVLTISNPEEF